MEEWRPVIGSEGIYEVSSCGAIRSLDRMVTTTSRAGRPMVRKHRGRILKPWSDGNGYLVVYICGEGRRDAINVHRIVATAFCEMRSGCNDVNHIDGVKASNAASNLEWVTRVENMAHALETGLCDRRMPILATSIATGSVIRHESVSAAARMLGCVKKSGNISSAANGKLKQAYGFRWSYV